MMGALQQRRSKKSDGDCEQPPLKPRAATPRTSCADAAALAALVFLASAAPVAPEQNPTAPQQPLFRSRTHLTQLVPARKYY